MTSAKSAMKNFLTLPLFLALLHLPLASPAMGQEGESFKMAGINVQRVFQEFHKTGRTEKQINQARIKIQKADRKVRAQLQRMERAVTAEAEKANDDSLSEDDKKALRDKLTLMLSERSQLNQERKKRYDGSNNQLNQDMINTMAGILGEIQRFVQSYAEENGFDIVFDLSGTSTNQLPPVMAGKGMADITSIVIAQLNQEDPNVDQKR